MCIVGLISLFAWNALFGAFGGLLLCIHQDFGVHVDDDAATCSGEHEQISEQASCAVVDQSCVDIELLAEQLPVVRLESDTSSLVPHVLLAILVDYLQAAEPSLELVYQSIEPCASPHVCWLTDFYLQTTVIRV
jgi:hypothetical protein